MNPIEKAVRRVDAVQQRHKAPAFVFGLIKKYGDDNGGVLVANLAHSGFVSLFPLLLVLVTLLGLVASNDPAVRHQVLQAVAHQVPIIGNQLTGNVQALRRSSIIGLVAGLIILAWGATGLAQAGLFTMGQVWNLPGPARPGYFPRLGRALVFLAVLGLGVVITTLLTSLGLYGHGPGVLAVAGEILVAATNIGMFFLTFRVLTPKGVPTRQLVPGAVAGGLAWTVAQALGTYVVGHFRNTDALYGAFATVLVLLAWISLSVEITVYAAELNVVLARRLLPRSIVQPPLTKPTVPSWRPRHCKTSGATTSASTCPTTTCRPTPPPYFRAHLMRSSRPHHPTGTARPSNAAPADEPRRRHPASRGTVAARQGGATAAHPLVLPRARIAEA